MSGPSEIEQAIRERIGASAFANWFGMEFVSAAEGSCEMRLELQPHHLNPGGIIHGGVIATMLDAAIGLALRSARPLGSPHVTLNMTIQYIGMASDGVIVARGRSLHAGRRAGHGEGELVTEDGRLLAKGTATFMAVEPQNLPRSPFALPRSELGPGKRKRGEPVGSPLEYLRGNCVRTRRRPGGPLRTSRGSVD